VAIPLAGVAATGDNEPMADAKAPAEEAKDEAPAGPKIIMGMPMVTFLFLVINLVVMAGAFAFILQASLFYKKPAITDAQATAEIQKREKKIETGNEVIAIGYPEMTITLRGEQGGKTRYATLEATVICGSETCKAQVDENRAKIQDAIQTVMSSRTYTELTSLETKFRVKHEILNQVNSYLKETAAVDILFTNFLVQ
jgi:flagellar FliL protein